MLKVVTGRFHPSLESAFVEQIQRLKAEDAWAAVAVIVPSKPILDRLRRLLAIDHRLSLLNVHLFTFHQFALRLAEERRRTDGERAFRIVDDLFFQYLVRHVAERRTDELPAFRRLGHSTGTWAALWSTIRDLKDGGVDSGMALQALSEGCFGHEDQEWLAALFSLHAAVENTSTALHAGSADDLAQALLPAISASPFVTGLSGVCYYGFYDLTQVQLSLFQEVAARVPTTLFFPLGSEPSYAFAQRFFDRHVQPLLGIEPAVHLMPNRSPPPEVSIHSVIGPEEELAVACRAILDLVETHGYRFDEIGVVVRTLEPYRTLLHAVFDRHRIPLAATGRRPLIHHPLCKTLLALAALPVTDFYRIAVLDVVTSPFYRRPVNSHAGALSPVYRPEQWRAAVEALNITHGLDEWKRLEQASASALEVDGDGEEAGALGPFEVAPEIIASLWNTVSPLLASYGDLPTRGSFGTLFEAFRRLAAAHLRRPDGNDADGNQPLWDAIDQTFQSLEALALIDDDLSWAAFAELLTHAFEQASVPIEPASPPGVMVLDAMAARGVPFKAMFLLGLNEKIFPRYIREDPFLRDRHRRVLEATLGYKVGEKLPGYDEEALLFTLLTQAAGRRLFLSFQRADEGGRLLAPSPYMTAMRQPGMPAPAVEVVPRRMTERMRQRPTMSRFLPPIDLAQWMAVVGKDTGEFLDATGGEAAMFRIGVDALARTDDEHPSLTAFDGLTGPLEPHWARLAERGCAPTPLERYARCPFRYFAADVLRLMPIRIPAPDEPDARVLGTFCHGALRRCYELLLTNGWPERPVDDHTVSLCIETAVEEAAADVERRHRTGHYVLWEMAKARITKVMTAAVADDLEAYGKEPFAPVAFELAAEGVIADVPGQEAAPLKIRGRIDRLDRHRDSGALRIIDYKLKLGKSAAPEDRQLAQSAVRGFRLQPPFYTQLHLAEYGTTREAQLVFLAPQWPKPILRSPFEGSLWLTDTGTMLRGTIGRLLGGIRSGRFFIVPETSCETCDFRVACRREHPATWWRATRAAESRELAALRAQKVGP